MNNRKLDEVNLMKKPIKLMSFFMAVALALTTAACGSKPEATTSEEQVLLSPEEKVENNKNITDDMVDLVQAGDAPDNAQTVVMSTSMGDITLVLYPDLAPKTVENFVELSKAGYYNGLKFHRVMANYLAQSGDPTGTGTGGESKDKAGLAQEYSLNLWHFRGALGMAPSSDGTNGSQFYMIDNTAVDEDTLSKMEDANFPAKVIDHYKKVGGTPWLDGKQTVFGHVVGGMDVLDAIVSVEVDENGKPKEDVIITSITVK